MGTPKYMENILYKSPIEERKKSLQDALDELDGAPIEDVPGLTLHELLKRSIAKNRALIHERERTSALEKLTKALEKPITFTTATILTSKPTVTTKRYFAEGAQPLLDSMSPQIRQLVEKDAKFRLVSVLRNVRDNKVQKQVGIGKLCSVLKQLDSHVANNGKRRDVATEWGSW